MDKFDLIKTLSAIEIGTMLSTFLFGITVVQAFVYFTRSAEDRPALKWLVSSILLLELGHEVAVLHAFYTISIVLYNRPNDVFATTPAGIAIATLLSGYIACVVQVFFADRLRRLTHKNYLTAFCWCLSFLRAVATTATTVVMFKTTLIEFTERWNWLVTTCLAIGAVVDIAVAVGLCLNLVKERKKSFTRTTKLLDRIMLMAIQTGLATSALTLAVTICFLLVTDSFAWVALYVCLARVFSNSLLATLNYRETLRQISERTTLRLARSTFGQNSESRQQAFNWDSIVPKAKLQTKQDEG